jgi:hypothetical protein
MGIMQALVPNAREMYVFMQATSSSRTTVSPTTGTAVLDFDGNDVEGNLTTFKYTWLIAGLFADFEVRGVHVSGTVASGVDSAWHDMTHQFSITRSTVGTTTSTFSVEIRRVYDSAIISAAVDWTLTATMDP